MPPARDDGDRELKQMLRGLDRCGDSGLLAIVPLVGLLFIIGLWDNQRTLQRVLGDGYYTTGIVRDIVRYHRPTLSFDAWRPRLLATRYTVDVAWRGRDGVERLAHRVPVTAEFVGSLLVQPRGRLASTEIRAEDDSSSIPVVIFSINAWLDQRSYEDIRDRGTEAIAWITDAHAEAEAGSRPTVSHTIDLAWRDSSGGERRFGATHVSEGFWRGIASNETVVRRQVRIRYLEDDRTARPVITDDLDERSRQDTVVVMFGGICASIGFMLCAATIRRMRLA